MANHDQKQQQAGGRPDLQLSKEWRPRPSWTRRKFLLVRRYGAGTKSLRFEGSEARSRRNVRAFRLSFKTTKLAPATENSQQNAGLSLEPKWLEPGRIFPLHALKVAPPVGESLAPNWGLVSRPPSASFDAGIATKGCAVALQAPYGVPPT